MAHLAVEVGLAGEAPTAELGVRDWVPGRRGRGCGFQGQGSPGLWCTLDFHKGFCGHKVFWQDPVAFLLCNDSR